MLNTCTILEFDGNLSLSWRKIADANLTPANKYLEVGRHESVTMA
jgi:hypothetical protein